MSRIIAAAIVSLLVVFGFSRTNQVASGFSRTKGELGATYERTR